MKGGSSPVWLTVMAALCLGLVVTACLTVVAASHGWRIEAPAPGSRCVDVAALRNDPNLTLVALNVHGYSQATVDRLPLHVLASSDALRRQGERCGDRRAFAPLAAGACSFFLAAATFLSLGPVWPRGAQMPPACWTQLVKLLLVFGCTAALAAVGVAGKERDTWKAAPAAVFLAAAAVVAVWALAGFQVLLSGVTERTLDEERVAEAQGAGVSAASFRACARRRGLVSTGVGVALFSGLLLVFAGASAAAGEEQLPAVSAALAVFTGIAALATGPGLAAHPRGLQPTLRVAWTGAGGGVRVSAHEKAVYDLLRKFAAAVSWAELWAAPAAAAAAAGVPAFGRAAVELPLFLLCVSLLGSVIVATTVAFTVPDPEGAAGWLPRLNGPSGLRIRARAVCLAMVAFGGVGMCWVCLDGSAAAVYSVGLVCYGLVALEVVDADEGIGVGPGCGGSQWVGLARAAAVPAAAFCVYRVAGDDARTAVFYASVLGLGFSSTAPLDAVFDLALAHTSAQLAIAADGAGAAPASPRLPLSSSLKPASHRSATASPAARPPVPPFVSQDAAAAARSPSRAESFSSQLSLLLLSQRRFPSEAAGGPAVGPRGCQVVTKGFRYAAATMFACAPLLCVALVGGGAGVEGRLGVTAAGDVVVGLAASPFALWLFSRAVRSGEWEAAERPLRVVAAAVKTGAAVALAAAAALLLGKRFLVTAVAGALASMFYDELKRPVPLAEYYASSALVRCVIATAAVLAPVSGF
ncbi:hypothetical protein DIPPA_05203 [Diplonema papillatum]|nr:hypothetical protein DIPPA_05203 [Diplonema papillatum]